MSNDAFHWWREAVEGRVGPIVEDEPQCGYYRTRRKGGPWEPVAIFHDNDQGGKLVALRGEDDADPVELWTWVAKHPVSYEAYSERMETGRWPNEIDEPMGSNSAHMTPAEEVAEELANLKRSWDGWLAEIGGKIETQEHSDKAATYAARFAEVEKKAGEFHKAEKAPHLEAGRLVDATWKPLCADADAGKRMVKAAMTAFLRAEAERVKAFAEKASEEFGGKVEVSAPKARGAIGRAVGLRTVQRVQINDVAQVAAFFATMKEPPAELVEVLEKLARRVLASKVEVPGAVLRNEEIAA